MKTRKRAGIILLAAAAVLAAVYLAGRFGWKLAGFRACQRAGIDSVEVRDGAVDITGFYPGSFPEGFCGCYAEETDGTLYVGFRFSAVFGCLTSGDFAVSIPVRGEIREVVMRTSMNDTLLWSGEFLPQSERYGVYVRLDRSDIYALSMSYAGRSGGLTCANGTALARGVYCYMDNDIMMAAKDAEAPVPFTVTARDASGAVAATGAFIFDAAAEKLYLTVLADNRITAAAEP